LEDYLNFSLLDNGVDSLKTAFTKIMELQDISVGKGPYIKDAVIYINHGIEILFKYILTKQNPSLVFVKLENYLKAKEKLKNSNDKKMQTVFDIDPTLKTVTLTEALYRIEHLCEIDIPAELDNSIHYLNKIRNKFMHYEVKIVDQEQFNKLILHLETCLVLSLDFLKEHINNLDALLNWARFYITDDEMDEIIADERLIPILDDESGWENNIGEETFGDSREEAEEKLRNYQDTTIQG
jgi:hypothetical protein